MPFQNDPSLEALAELYRKSIDADPSVAAISEQAVFNLAAGEAALAEAATLLAFAESAQLMK